ncbi:MAG TPA: helix-turn-helix transcriptional regulator [Geminicoccaceae bacterium]|nr:helix-turn-helix transcriptional regulator [Geminicoccaceae bacterium]
MRSGRGQPGFGARLRALRQAHGLSQVELARRIGRHQTVIGPYERDEYAPSYEIVLKLAQVLETSPEFLCFGRGSARPGVRLIGRIGPGGLFGAAREDGDRLLELREGRLAAVLVEDDCMAPVLRHGQVVLIAGRAGGEPVCLLGRDVLADLVDGRTLLRRLLPGGEPTRFDLGAYNAPALRNVALVAARPVLGVLAGEAFAPAGGSAAAV